MPDYKSARVCLCGDTDNIALDNDGCFAIVDHKGRNWLCLDVPVTEHHLEQSLEEILTTIPDMQKKLIAAGFADTGGTLASLHLTIQPEGYTLEQDLASLRQQLSREVDGTQN